MKKWVKAILATLILVVIFAVMFYVTLPAINPYSQDFWIMLTFGVIIWGVAYALLGVKSSDVKVVGKININKKSPFVVGIVIAALVPVLVLVGGNIVSSTFFNAKAYSEIITVKEAVFEEDMPETDTVTNIALMDSESAIKIGNRTLGTLSDVISQYEIAGTYSQINLASAPAKVANLEYADFFKWLNNRDSGIPGYVKVDPVNSDAEYVRFQTPIKYVESAYFNENLSRKLRFSYPTKIFGSSFFEIDEEGNPYYIVSCLAPKVGLFGAMDVNEVIIFNPVDGSSEIYDLAATPAWVDNVFTGYLATQKYDWHGMLKNGYWNSVIGNKDCKVTTDDFGYIILGDDVWYFTGVTSVGNDESNIGFIISNARTGEYKFYAVDGAEEYSAMAAAEGEVQDMGYTASFPSLINVSGEATYIMVLKDRNGMVKLRALVNVENYSIVATGETQTQAKQAYIEKLKINGIIDAEDAPTPPADTTKTEDIKIVDIKTMTIGGNSVIYLEDEEGRLFKQAVSDNESLLLLDVGDSVKITFADTDIEKIKKIVSLEIVTE